MDASMGVSQLKEKIQSPLKLNPGKSVGRKLEASDVTSQYLIHSSITDINTIIQCLIYLLFFRSVNSTKPASKVREERNWQDSSKDTRGKGPGMGRTHWVLVLKSSKIFITTQHLQLLTCSLRRDWSLPPSLIYICWSQLKLVASLFSLHTFVLFNL